VKTLSVPLHIIFVYALFTLYSAWRSPIKHCYIAFVIPWSIVLPCSSFRILGPGPKYSLNDHVWDWRLWKSHDVYGMYSSCNLAELEKCFYINGLSPCLSQVSASKDCGRCARGEGGLACKVSGLRTMLFHFVLSGSVSSYRTHRYLIFLPLKKGHSLQWHLKICQNDMYGTFSVKPLTPQLKSMQE
jgi:hypothetical protein